MILSRYASRIPATLLALCAIPSLGWAGAKSRPSIPTRPREGSSRRSKPRATFPNRLMLLELFPELFPASPAVEYVWSELQARYHQAGKLDKALAAGSNVLDLQSQQSGSSLSELAHRGGYERSGADHGVDEASRQRCRESAEDSRSGHEPGDASSAATARAKRTSSKRTRTPSPPRIPRSGSNCWKSFSRIIPRHKHADDIEITVFLAYREQGDAAKALAAAEKLVAHNDTREDAMLLVAESYFKSGKDPNAVVSLSKKAIDRLNKAEKPDGHQRRRLGPQQDRRD